MERINFKNRSSTNSDWRKISIQNTSADGKEIIAKITRSDTDVTEEGTQIDANIMNSLQDNIENEFNKFQNQIDTWEEIVQSGGTTIKINNATQENINFDSDPQTQINILNTNLLSQQSNKANIDASNLPDDNIESWQNKLNVNVQTETITSRDGKTGTRYKGQSTVIESYVSSDGLTWYRIWSDGWKECGGRMTYAKTNAGFNGTITFPFTFTNGPFINVTSFTTDNSNPLYLLGISRLTADIADIGLYPFNSAQYSSGFCWVACGY